MRAHLAGRAWTWAAVLAFPGVLAAVLGGEGPAGQAATPPPTRAAPPASRPTTAPAPPEQLVPIPLKLPQPRFSGLPKNIPPGVRVLVAKGPVKPRPPFLAPKGVANVAMGKPVTASDMEPVIGKLGMVTDGNKEAAEDAYVELGPGTQWVRIDLGKPFRIYAIVVWHEHKNPLIYHDVIVQVARRKDFADGARTVYNNDHDNSAGLGAGRNWGYFETNEALLIDAKGAAGKGVTGRYVRLYSNGNTADDLNRYTEVEVYALPAGPASRPAPLPAETVRQVERLVGRLGAESYRDRRGASAELEKLGPHIIQVLQRYAEHPDMEVRTRVGAILAALRKAAAEDE